MPDAMVTIGGDASGALAAIAATQAAINGLTGKTVKIGVDSSGLGAAIADMGKVGDAAKTASKHSGDLGNSMRNTADHTGRAADNADRLRTHMAAVDNIMRGGAPGAVQHSEGLRQMAVEAQSASRSMGELGSGTRDVQKAIGAGDAGGFRSMGAAARGTSVEVMGIYRNTRQAITAAGEAGTAFSTASGHTSQMGTDLARMGSQAGGAGSELAKVSRGAMEMSKGADGVYRTVDALGKIMDGPGGGGGGLLSGWGDIGSTIGALPGMAGAASGAIRGVGMATVYSAAGMGILGAAVAGVGLAGVAEDFTHNSQLMNQGQDALRGFNKEFRQMRSESSAAGMPQMDALKASAAGVGHELAKIGADNMGATLGHANELAGSLTQTMRQLEPAIGPSEQALTSLAGAALGAFGNSAPEIARFANSVTQNADGLQSATESIIRGGSALATGAVKTASALAPFLSTAATGIAGAVDIAGGMFGQQSNAIARPGPDGSTDQVGAGLPGLPDGHGGVAEGTGTSGGSSWLNRAFSGASKGAIGGAAVGLLGGPLAEITAPLGGLAGGLIGGVAGVAGVPGFAPADSQAGGGAPTYGAPMTQAQMFGKSRTGGGNFDSLGAGGLPKLPAGTSSTAAQDAYNQQYQGATGAMPGAPRYSGVGPRGPGSAVGAMPAPAAVGLGGGSIQPFNNMIAAAAGGAQAAAPMQSAGQAAVKHFTKAIDQGSSEAASAGAGMGASVGSGIGTGMTKTETVNDTIMRKHIQKIIDAGQSEGEIHSPSRKTRRMLGQPLGEGTALGVQDAFGANRDAVGSLLGHYGNEAQAAATISMRRKSSTQSNYGDPQAAQQAVAPAAGLMNQAMAYSSPLANANIQAHNDRAAGLAAGRANLHQLALANVDPAHHAQPGTFVDGGKILGQGLAQGLGYGVQQNAKVAVDPVSVVSRMMQSQFKKDNGINSPSTVYAGYGGNNVAGVGVGFAGGASGATSVMTAATAAMAAAVQGPMNDYGLQVGYTFVQGISDGVSRQVKKTDYAALGLPTDQINVAAMQALVAAGLLRAGSGASTTKTGSGGSDTVILPAAPPQTITINVQHMEGDRMIGIADQQIELAFNQATGTYQTL